jgi:hypothetical protein
MTDKGQRDDQRNATISIGYVENHSSGHHEIIASLSAAICRCEIAVSDWFFMTNSFAEFDPVKVYRASDMNFLGHICTHRQCCFVHSPDTLILLLFQLITLL